MNGLAAAGMDGSQTASPARRFPLTPSLWYASAIEPPQTQPLADDVSTDILIIGAGYTGLNAALRLAELGHRPLLVEVQEAGFGSSGRNGGQIVPGLKWEPETLLKRFGPAEGERLVDFAGNTAQTVMRIVDKHDLQVPMQRNGWIQPAHNAKGLELARDRHRQWRDRGVDAQWLDAHEAARLLGSTRYVGGWLDPRGGALHPLSYARELARAALRQGATLHTGTLVRELRREGAGWLAVTGHGHRICARAVLVCANAYDDGLWDGVRQSIVDPNTYMTATVPLAPEVADSILPEGHPASDTRNLLFYFRKDHTGRFLMGGRGPFREPRSRDDWGHLRRAAVKLYPQLAGIEWEYHWCGRVAVTRDYLPHLHEPAPDLLINVGCMGRGVGLQTAMGEAMADYLHTRDVRKLPLPPSALRPLPMHGLRRLYVSAVVSWYRLSDGGMS